MEDSQFIRGQVPMTKEEVRAVSLAKLELYRAEKLLDIGAGTGSISIEAALSYPHLKVMAIEEKEEALDLIRRNQEKFACQNLTLLPGHAPLDLENQFDAIFIGGTGGDMEAILDWSLDHMQPGARLVMNFILLENVWQAQAWAEKRGLSCQLSRLTVEQYVKLGPGHYWKPQNPIVILKMVKGMQSS